MRYCSLDLEMEQPCGHIIQIGAVIGDIREKKEKWRRDMGYVFDAYVKPFTCCKDGEISEFIQDLCSINTDEYRHTAWSYQTCIDSLAQWLVTEGVSHVLQWGYGGADWRKLHKEYSKLQGSRGMQMLETPDNPLPRLKDVNVKQLYYDYIQATSHRKGVRMIDDPDKWWKASRGLKDAADRLGVEFYGYPHDALNDAATTVLVYKELLRRIKNAE